MAPRKTREQIFDEVRRAVGQTTKAARKTSKIVSRSVQSQKREQRDASVRRSYSVRQERQRTSQTPRRRRQARQQTEPKKPRSTYNYQAYRQRVVGKTVVSPKSSEQRKKERDEKARQNLRDLRQAMDKSKQAEKAADKQGRLTNEQAQAYQNALRTASASRGNSAKSGEVVQQNLKAYERATGKNVSKPVQKRMAEGRIKSPGTSAFLESSQPGFASLEQQSGVKYTKKQKKAIKKSEEEHKIAKGVGTAAGYLAGAMLTGGSGAGAVTKSASKAAGRMIMKSAAKSAGKSGGKVAGLKAAQATARKTSTKVAKKVAGDAVAGGVTGAPISLSTAAKENVDDNGRVDKKGFAKTAALYSGLDVAGGVAIGAAGRGISKAIGKNQAKKFMQLESKARAQGGIKNLPDAERKEYNKLYAKLKERGDKVIRNAEEGEKLRKRTDVRRSNTKPLETEQVSREPLSPGTPEERALLERALETAEQDKQLKTAAEQPNVGYHAGARDDSASTIIMKELGFDGVDVRGMKGLDNTEYGSVIYDLRPNEAPAAEATAKNLRTAGQLSDEEYDMVRQFKDDGFSDDEIREALAADYSDDAVNRLIASADEEAPAPRVDDEDLQMLKELEEEAGETGSLSAESKEIAEDIGERADTAVKSRPAEDISSQKVNAYQYDHPEVKDFYQAEAREMLDELSMGVKGERIALDRWDNPLDTTTGSKYTEIKGLKRRQSDSITELLDDWKMSYADIRKALNSIVDDKGAENTANAKKVEAIIDKRLRQGYTGYSDGVDVPPNGDYIALAQRLYQEEKASYKVFGELTKKEFIDQDEEVRSIAAELKKAQDEKRGTKRLANRLEKARAEAGETYDEGAAKYKEYFPEGHEPARSAEAPTARETSGDLERIDAENRELADRLQGYNELESKYRPATTLEEAQAQNAQLRKDLEFFENIKEDSGSLNAESRAQREADVEAAVNALDETPTSGVTSSDMPVPKTLEELDTQNKELADMLQARGEPESKYKPSTSLEEAKAQNEQLRKDLEFYEEIEADSKNLNLDEDRDLEEENIRKTLAALGREYHPERGNVSTVENATAAAKEPPKPKAASAEKPEAPAPKQEGEAIDEELENSLEAVRKQEWKGAGSQGAFFDAQKKVYKDRGMAVPEYLKQMDTPEVRRLDRSDPYFTQKLAKVRENQIRQRNRVAKQKAELNKTISDARAKGQTSEQIEQILKDSGVSEKEAMDAVKAEEMARKVGATDIYPQEKPIDVLKTGDTLSQYRGQEFVRTNHINKTALNERIGLSSKKDLDEFDEAMRRALGRKTSVKGLVRDEDISAQFEEILKEDGGYRKLKAEILADGSNIRLDDIQTASARCSVMLNEAHAIAIDKSLPDTVRKIAQDDYDEIFGVYADIASKSGANMAAFNRYRFSTPGGRVKAGENLAKRITERFKDNLNGEKLELTEEQTRRLAAAKTKEEAEQICTDIAGELIDKVPVGTMQKINEFRHMAMLLNVRTHGRNLFSNMVFGSLRTLSDGLEILFQMAGKGVIERRGGSIDMVRAPQKWIRVNRKELDAEFARIYKASGSRNKYLESALASTDKTLIERGKHIAPKPLWKATAKLVKLNYKALEAEDMVTFKRVFRTNYGRYVEANGLDFAKMTEAQKDSARRYALDRAEYATFRDDSAASDWIIKLKERTAAKKGKTGIGTAAYRSSNAILEGLLPFVKTPVNVFRRTVDYSPVKFVASIPKLAQTKDVELFKQGLHDMATGITGTGVMLMGAYLAQRGWVTTHAGDESGSEYYDRDMGYQDYSMKLNIGGKKQSWTIDWASPTQASIFMGAQLYKTFVEGSQKISPTEFVNVMLMTCDPLVDTSFMASTKDTIQQFQEQAERGQSENAGENDWGGAMAQLLLGKLPQNYASSFLPQLMAQTAMATDTYQRDTRSTKKDALAKSWDSFGKQLCNKVPVLREVFLNPKIDRRGRDVETTGNNLAMKILFAAVNPSTVKNITEDEHDRKLIEIYNELPDEQKKYFYYNMTGNPDYQLTDDKRMNYDELYKYGKESRIQMYKMQKEMFDARSYDNMTIDMKSAEIKDGYYLSQTFADEKTYGADFAVKRLEEGDHTSDADLDAIRFCKSNGIGNKEFLKFYKGKEKLLSRAHAKDYQTKALALAVTNMPSLALAYDIHDDKLKTAQDYVKKKGKAKAVTDYTNASCNIEATLKKAEVTNASSIKKAMAAAEHKIDADTYKALGITSQKANAGMGLKKSGYTFEDIDRIKDDMKLSGVGTKKQDIIDYIEGLGITSENEKACLFEALCRYGNTKNPYSMDTYIDIEDDSKSSGKGYSKGYKKGYRRYGRRRSYGRRRGGHRGGGSSGKTSTFDKDWATYSAEIQGTGTSGKTSTSQAYLNNVRKLRQKTLGG